MAEERVELTCKRKNDLNTVVRDVDVGQASARIMEVLKFRIRNAVACGRLSWLFLLLSSPIWLYPLHDGVSWETWTPFIKYKYLLVKQIFIIYHRGLPGNHNKQLDSEQWGQAQKWTKHVLLQQGRKTFRGQARPLWGSFFTVTNQTDIPLSQSAFQNSMMVQVNFQGS